MLAPITARLILACSWVITAARGIWHGSSPEPRQRIYFANHNSHGDFILVWAVLPDKLRRLARPVAGADYWLTSRAKRFLIQSVFKAVLIDRTQSVRQVDPIEIMAEALGEGASLILFPEGTRNTTDKPLLAFKSGLYYLAKARPEVDLVPVWIDNLNRVMPKGALVPVPLMCTVTFGAALRLENEEAKRDFLARAERALLGLAPNSNDTNSTNQRG